MLFSALNYSFHNKGYFLLYDFFFFTSQISAILTGLCELSDSLFYEKKRVYEDYLWGIFLYEFSLNTSMFLKVMIINCLTQTYDID